MNLTPEQIEYHKKVGKLKDKIIFEVATKGGLHLILMSKNGGFETLGAGPHRAIARHIASKREPDIMYTELSKSDYIDEIDYIDFVPKYEILTDRIRSLNGDD